jgi:nickel-dependent lactate racemase
MADGYGRPMTSVHLSYGRHGLDVALLGEDPLVVVPRDAPAVPDPAAAITAALRDPIGCPPLRDQLAGVRTVAISVCDGTRAQPREVMVAGILAELDAAADVTVLVATGSHRGNSEAELAEMLGPVRDRVRVVNHDARDRSTLTHLGRRGDGVDLWLNREWVEADLRITTGFVEPHFFAGFSGGPKMVAPGLAGIDTIMTLHDARRIGDPAATWGPVEDNPVHRDIRACAAACPPHLALDVLLDRRKRITHVYAGELSAMHAAATGTALEVAMRPVPALYDVVVTTGSGYPLDQNLYQAVKGMAAAERVVRPDGTVVIAAECADGLPAHGSFAQVLGAADSPSALLELIGRPGFAVPDQWQVQVLARVLSRARVELFCAGLTDAEVRAAHLTPIEDVGAAVARALERHGPGARACYLPEGPQTIPYVSPRTPRLAA